MPEWYFIVILLFILVSLGFLWQPLLWAIALLIPTVGLLIVQAIISAIYNQSNSSNKPLVSTLILTSWLHLIQPIARLKGRFVNGLTPWRRRTPFKFTFPLSQTKNILIDVAQSSNFDLNNLEQNWLQQELFVSRGGTYDSWDLEIRRGIWGSVRTVMVVEYLSQTNQLIRFKAYPVVSPLLLISIILFTFLAFFAWADEAFLVAGILLSFTAVITVQIIRYCGASMAYHNNLIDELHKS